MRLIQHLAIKTKLSLLALSAAGTALLLSSTAFVLYDVQRVRASTVKQLSTLADVLGDTSTAALLFDDEATAEELLASLQQQPSVKAAALYDDQGRLFATYTRPGFQIAVPETPPQLGVQFTKDDHLLLAQEITHNGRRVGRICLHATLEELYEQLQSYVAIVGLIFTGALAATGLLSARLQRMISDPILSLANLASRVSETRDFSLRAPAASGDEMGTLYQQFNAMLDEIERGQARLRKAHGELEQRVEQRTLQLTQANEELSREVAERDRAERELDAVHTRLLDTARRAGMAEIATGVLHNVGNVLNSINVSVTLVVERLRLSRTDQLQRVVQLLDGNADRLGSFLTEDEKGRQVPGFLNLVTEHLVEEQRELLQEMESLINKVNHVKTIVATQQAYAGVSGVTETFDVGEALEDSLQLQVASLERHGIVVRRDFEPLPPLSADKQKVLQILVNLIKNAKDAIMENESGHMLTLRTRCVEDRVQIEVHDDGVGIPPENLTRIFTHGFTTKAHGHGFGLHSCANAAAQMGGSLTAQSEGPGMGSSFTLEIPLKQTTTETFSCATSSAS